MNKELINEIQKIKKLSKIPYNSDNTQEIINEGVLDSISDFLSKASSKILELPVVKKLKDFYETKKNSPVTSSKVIGPNDLDLNKPEHYYVYRDICEKFIDTRKNNLLGITGDMLAKAAKNTQNTTGKFVPPELALAQLTIEGGFTSKKDSRPIRTNNPFNVGNTDSGKNVYHGSVESGIQTYYNLIGKNYLVGDKTPNDLLNDFVNKNGHRYAASGYEEKVKKIANDVKRISEPLYASLKDKKQSNIT